MLRTRAQENKILKATTNHFVLNLLDKMGKLRIPVAASEAANWRANPAGPEQTEAATEVMKLRVDPAGLQQTGLADDRIGLVNMLAGTAIGAVNL